MNSENMTVRVHFIDGEVRIVEAKDIRQVGEEGARRAIAIYEGKEYPIYRRSEPEWGDMWYEQELSTLHERSIEEIEEEIVPWREKIGLVPTQEINRQQEEQESGTP